MVDVVGSGVVGVVGVVVAVVDVVVNVADEVAAVAGAVVAVADIAGVIVDMVVVVDRTCIASTPEGGLSPEGSVYVMVESRRLNAWGIVEIGSLVVVVNACTYDKEKVRWINYMRGR